MNKIVSKLLSLLPKFDIVKTIDGVETLYLRRYFLFRSPFLNVYLHEFFRSDDDPDPHDHPWDFITVVLKGGYTDEAYEFYNIVKGADPAAPFYKEKGSIHPRPYLFESPGVRSDPRCQVVQPGQIVFRKAEHVHRVILTNGKAWTMVVTGRTRRPWGFVKNGMWVFWRLYLGVWGNDHA